jgi:nucleoside-diphosphate-sugar epimerase
MDLQDGRVFADFVADIVKNRDILMKSDGSAVRSFCYLSDAILGFFTVLLSGKNAEAYNIGNDKGEISIADLADMLVKLYPEKGLKVMRSNTASQEGYLRSKISRNSPDISKANALGWKPNVSLPEGFARTIRSFINVHERT